MKKIANKIKLWAKMLKKDILALWFCQKDPAMPLAAKLAAIFIVAYAFSPIDLIPDFIPVFGYLDDILIVPIGIYFTLKLIPAQVLVAGRAKAGEWMAQQHCKPKNWLAAGAIVLIWLFLVVIVWRALCQPLPR